MEKNKFAKKKKIKCYPLSFPILGGRDSTRALQTSLQKYKKLKISKITKKELNNAKKCYPLSFPILGL